MPSRPRADIEPIHVHELLNGAGMTGFLSVLDPPAGGGSEDEPFASARLRANALLAQVRRQDEVLSAIMQMARRINRGAAKLRRHAEAVRQRRETK